MSAQAASADPAPRGEGFDAHSLAPARGSGEGARASPSLLSVLLAPLAACGKKGPPEPPPDEPNTYPQIYPP